MTKILFILVILLLICTPAFSQIIQTNPDSIPFAQAVNYGTGTNPYSIFCADLDGDNDQDLAVANAYSGNVSILINSGDGTFQNAVNYTVGYHPYSVFCADLDGDNYRDLAVANSYNNNVSILKNNRDGTFQSAVNYGTGIGPTSVFCADLDGDNDRDLVVANRNSNNVSILKNKGDGTFNSAVNYPAGTGPTSVFCADLDGDGDLDLAVANYGSNNVSILKNNGIGIFSSAVNHPVGNGPTSIFCADLDGDNDLDLAVPNGNNNNVSILKNNGDGTFTSPVNYVTGSFPFSVFCADLDGDHNLDLAVANSNSSNISIFKNRGDGTFKNAVNYWTGSNPFSVFCADLNGDAHPDLAVANYSDNNISILINLNIDPKQRLLSAITELENAIKARDSLIAQDFSWTMVYAYRSVHDLDAMWTIIGLWQNTYDVATLVYSLGTIPDKAGDELLHLKDLGVPIGSWIVGVSIGAAYEWTNDQYINRICAYTLQQIDGFKYVNDNQLYTEIQNLVMNDPNSIQIQSQVEYATQICSNLRQYIRNHDFNDYTSFNQLIKNMIALAQDIRTSNEEGEKEVVKWYCPTSHTNVNPPIPEKVYNITNLGDWTTYYWNSSYYNSMYSMWEEITNNRRTELTGYTATVVVAGAALAIKTGLISFFSGGTLTVPETMLALDALGTITSVTTNSYKAIDASAAASSIISIVQTVAPATERDLIEMDMMLNDVKTYVERSMDPAYPPDAFPFGVALIYDMDIPHTVYHSGGDVPVLIEGTVKLRNYGPYEGKANLYFEVKARSGPLRGQTISIASIAEPVNVPVSQYVQIPFSITVPQSWLLGGEGRFVANPHATIGAGRFSLSSVTFDDRCFEVIETDKKGNLDGRDVFNSIMQDSIGQGDSLSASYTSNSYETEFWLDHTEGSMTLQLYDNAGNHTGYNYETQQIETEIPGSSYIGSSLSTDLIAIVGSMGQQYTIQVKGIAIEGKQAFDVTAEEISEHPPSLMTAPPSLVATGFLGDTIDISFEIYETGCHHQVNGLTLLASDFVGGDGSIPSSNVVFDLAADSIPACQNVIARAKISIPIDVPINDYVGSFSVNSLNGGSDQISLTIHLENPPNKPTTPSGPLVGLTNVDYQYTSTTVDPDNDSVYYLFDWDDSTHYIWSKQASSAQPCTVSHSWGYAGSYNIKVKAMDIWNLQSVWSDSILVIISLMRGDANGDGLIDVGDVVYLINYLFKSGSAPNPLLTGDVNCDLNVDVGDVVYLINYLFKGGPAASC